MTLFTRRIRQHLDRVAARRGRPVLLAVRMPDTFELARNVGLDVRDWLEEGLFDILVAGGGYAPFTLSVAELARVAHQYGVPVYPCINQGPAHEISQGAFCEGVRAMAANWHRAGADGVYTFNLFVPFDNKYGDALAVTRREVYACLDEIGEGKTLQNTDKRFAIDNQDTGHYAFVSNRPPLPVRLNDGEVHRMSLVVGDDLESAAQAGSLGELELQLTLTSSVGKDIVVVKLNGQPLTGGDFSTFSAEKPKHQLSFLVDAPPCG